MDRRSPTSRTSLAGSTPCLRGLLFSAGLRSTSQAASSTTWPKTRRRARSFSASAPAEAAHSRAGGSSTAGVEAACLAVTYGIVWIVVGIDGAGNRRSGGIDRLTGVAAGERERRERENDGDPHRRVPM